MKSCRLDQQSLLVVALLLTVGGCTPQKTSPESSGAAVVTEVPVAPPAQAAAASADQKPSIPLASPGKPAAPVRIELLAHPDTVSGSPADLVVLITPTSAVDRVSGEITAGDGLQMAPRTFELDAAAAGRASRHAIQVTRIGAATGFVQVIVESWQGDSRQTKVILLPVNGGEAVVPKATAPVQTLPDGERIISLPVEETAH